MNYYLQVNRDGVITDVIDYQNEGYMEFKGEIPIGVNGGWFKYENGAIVEYPELKPKSENEEIQIIKQAQADLVFELMVKGVI